MGEPARSEDDATAPLELAHYAWVSAALAEGFGMDEVLAIEGLEPEVWSRAELSWRTRLATELDIHDDYRAHLAQAEDELGGQITPLDDDLKAWVVFLRIYGDHPAPFQLLAEQQLRPGDLARLHRKWARRLEADDDLVERAEKLRDKVAARAEDGEQLPLATITVAPGALSASPHARTPPRRPDDRLTAAEGAASPVTASGGPELSLYEYASLCASLDDEGVDRAAVLQSFGLSLAAGERVEQLWRARMAADPALAADFRNLHRHFNEREGLRGVAPPLHEAPPTRSEPEAAPVAAVVARAPVGPWSGPPAEPPGPPAPTPKPPHPRDPRAFNRQLGRTVEAVDVIPQVALPFSAKKSSDPSKGAASPSSKGSAVPDASASAHPRGYNPDLGKTAAVGAKVPKLTLPFRIQQLLDASAAGAEGPEPTPPGEGPSEAPQGSEPPPPVEPAPESAAAQDKRSYNPDLAQTAAVGSKVPKITLPFSAKQAAGSSAGSEPAPPGERPSEPPERIERPAAKHSCGYNPDLGKTKEVGGEIAKITLPFRMKQLQDARKQAIAATSAPSAANESIRSESSPPPARAAEPPGAPGGGDPPDAAELGKQVAGWKVNHYASLCAELAEKPERADEIRVRYGLRDEASEQYVHELFQMRFVEDDELRRKWQRLLKEYRQALAQTT